MSIVVVVGEAVVIDAVVVGSDDIVEIIVLSPDVTAVEAVAVLSAENAFVATADEAVAVVAPDIVVVEGAAEVPV